MTQNWETFSFLLYGAVVLALILVAILIAWLDKRFGGKQRDPLRTAVVRLKYATLIATIVIFVLWIRLPPGVHIGSVDATESLQRLLDKMLQTIAIGLVVCSLWFAAAYGAIRQLSASFAFKGVVPKATREPV
jgi:MFS-type transporter involved in bile tolerance (Atg22 family)